MRDDDWVAHRGYPMRYPENTTVGLQAAIEAGAHRIETDVQLSADGVPVLFHDRDLRRVCGVSGAVHELGADELVRLRASEPDFFGQRFTEIPLATLDDLIGLLERHEHVECFVEIKPVSLERFGVERTVAVVAERLEPVAQRCVVISFDPRVPAEAGRRGADRTGWIAARWEQVVELPAEVRRISHLFCNAVKAPRSGSLAASGPLLGLYDVIDRDVAARLMDRGAGMIETFDIGAMLGGFRRRDPDPVDG